MKHLEHLNMTVDDRPDLIEKGRHHHVRPVFTIFDISWNAFVITRGKQE